MTIRALIVDDEPPARRRLRALLAAERDVILLPECDSGANAVASIQTTRPDLVFLDVQMPEIDGFDVLDAIEPECRPAVVFVTAYDMHAVRAFEAHALDYLLKPFTDERFARALVRARAHLDRGADHAAWQARLSSMLDAVEAHRRYLRRLVVRSGGAVTFVRTAAITWLEAANNHVLVHAGRDTHRLRTTLRDLESRLDPASFVRIHRSTIVNIECMAKVELVFHGEYLVHLTDGTRLTASRVYEPRLRRLLTNDI